MRHRPAERPQDEVLLHNPKGRGKFWGVAFGVFLAGAMTTFVYFTRFVQEAPVPADPPQDAAQVAAQPPVRPKADKITLGQGVGVELEAFGKGELPGGLGALIKAFTQQYGTLHVNQSVDENPLRIGKEQFTNGLGTHSTSKIRLELGGKYKALSGLVGADAETIGTIVFKIANDKGAVLFTSLLMQRDMSAAKFEVAVAGSQYVDLIVEDGGNGIDYDHADWVNLKLN
jgi:hypothetical protein